MERWRWKDGDGKRDSNGYKIKVASKSGQSQEDSNG